MVYLVGTVHHGKVHYKTSHVATLTHILVFLPSLSL